MRKSPHVGDRQPRQQKRLQFVHEVEDGFDVPLSAMMGGLTGTCTTDFFENMTGQAIASTAEIAVTKQGPSWKLGLHLIIMRTRR